MTEKLKIKIVDDNTSFCEGLKFFIENTLSYKVISIENNGKEFLDSYNYKNADIILMDIEMPECNGFEAAKIALWSYRDLKIIAITSYEDKIYLKKLVLAGFMGCVIKEKVHTELKKAIQTVMNGKFYFPDTIKLE